VVVVVVVVVGGENIIFASTLSLRVDHSGHHKFESSTKYAPHHNKETYPSFRSLNNLDTEHPHWILEQKDGDIL
jgi:hypothetical protein